MSRSYCGGKPTGWEYWGKRKGSFFVDRRTSHKLERMQLKELNKVEIEDGINEIYSDENINYVGDKTLKSLFPKAQTIHRKYDYLEDRHFYEVDGKVGAYQDTVDYLLSYQYFIGASYSDIDDLAKKACDDGALHGDMYWFLP